VRIIAGRWRGRRLASVGKGDPGAHLRPTTDRVRESLFNTLAGGRFGNPFVEARVLDMFAGTGALGLEALSRGAVHATFVEKGRVGAKLIRENLRSLAAEDETRLLTCDARRLPLADVACKLVFLDPPYGQELGGPALLTAMAQGWIAPGALIVWEEKRTQTAPEGFVVEDCRAYGDSKITLMRALA